MMTLIALLIALALTMGTFVVLESLLGRLVAALLCPAGWLLVLAAEGLADVVRGEAL